METIIYRLGDISLEVIDLKNDLESELSMCKQELNKK